MIKYASIALKTAVLPLELFEQPAFRSFCQRSVGKQTGAVLAEWVIVFPVFVFLLLSAGQISFLFLTKQTVDYAAFITARAMLVRNDNQAYIPNSGENKPAALVLMGITGLETGTPYEETADPDVVHLAERYRTDARSHADFLRKYTAALDKTRVQAIRSREQDGRASVKLDIVYDYQMDFPLVNQILWKMSGCPDRYGYPHLSIHSSVYLKG